MDLLILLLKHLMEHNVILSSFNYVFGDFWTASGRLSPSIVGDSKFGHMEREFASHQHRHIVAAALYNVSVWSYD